MKITINYSIGDVLKKIDNGNATPEILFLKSEIDKYQSEISRRIEQNVKTAYANHSDHIMRWIQEDVDFDIRHYVRLAVQGKSYDVLRKNANKWKTIADIGIKVEEPEKNAVNYDEWFANWNLQASRFGEIDAPIFETHAHYDLDNFCDFREKLMNLMMKAGINRFIIPSIEYRSCSGIKAIFDKQDYASVYYSFGSHPKYLWKEKWGEQELHNFRKLLDDPKCVAVGECGLDYSYLAFNEEHKAIQADMFGKFIDFANSKQLPMILHIRSADDVSDCYWDAKQDALEILQKHHIQNGAVLHCFGGNFSDVKLYLERGVTHFGIGGRICYGNKTLEEAVRDMPEDSVLLETDAPYIRLDSGRMPNTSLSLLDIAAKIAEIRNTTVEHIFEITYKNAMKLFYKCS